MRTEMKRIEALYYAFHTKVEMKKVTMIDFESSFFVLLRIKS